MLLIRRFSICTLAYARIYMYSRQFHQVDFTLTNTHTHSPEKKERNLLNHNLHFVQLTTMTLYRRQEHSLLLLYIVDILLLTTYCCDFVSQAAEGVLRMRDKSPILRFRSPCLQAHDKRFDVDDNLKAAQNCMFLGFKINHYWVSKANILLSCCACKVYFMWHKIGSLRVIFWGYCVHQVNSSTLG